jgi:hypothetical protein
MTGPRPRLLLDGAAARGPAAREAGRQHVRVHGAELQARPVRPPAAQAEHQRAAPRPRLLALREPFVAPQVLVGCSCHWQNKKIKRK